LTLLQGKRSPVVAGLFYPAKADELNESIHSSFKSDFGPGTFPSRNITRSSSEPRHKKPAECLVVPHAGYIYSGPFAAYSYLKAFEYLVSSDSNSVTAIILGPNHYGIGSGVSLSECQFWTTPLGDVRVDEEVSFEISKRSEIVDYDQLAHSREHSIEVQVPFLQVVCSIAEKDLAIVPICLMLQDRETAEQISKSLLSVIRERKPGSTLVLGSSDLTHYEPQIQASSKDTKLLATVSNMNILDFYNVLERLNVTACGYGAIASTMYAAIGLGCRRGDVLKYGSSADCTGDKSSVVGYSSVEFN